MIQQNKRHTNTLEIHINMKEMHTNMKEIQSCMVVVQDLEETASVGRGSPVQQELEDSETEASIL